MQTAYTPYSGPADMNEDCLFLNIFTPDLDSRDDGRGRGKLPVIVYIHGGGAAPPPQGNIAAVEI